MSYATMHKAAVRFAKDAYALEECNAELEKRKPRYGIMGANCFHHPLDPVDAQRQYITDGTIGVCYDKGFTDLAVPPEDNPIDYARCLYINPYYKGYEFQIAKLPDLVELKELWKQERKRWSGWREKKYNIAYRLVAGDRRDNTVVVDITKLILLMELMDCKGGEEIKWYNAITPLFIDNVVSDRKVGEVRIEGFICPVRTVDTRKCLNDQEESKVTYMWGRDGA